ncbi:MAG: long-chain fatty acid--CoA ligase [Bacteroidetes bacterium HGW-Bacteroidetes-4]|jgi:long-chain acyl-CoA synthetase|nr:MAG: long-chain fatty acid--CoA ligase [Bacteroidetes bacterium HGW-Bacteroidetes-4]
MLKENYIQMLEDSLKHHWDLPAMADYAGDMEITYGELAKKIMRFHVMFEVNGIEPGDKIAVIGRNSVNWSVVFLATVSYGAVIVPILPDFKPNNVHHIVNHSEAKVLFTQDDKWDSLDESSMPDLRAVFSLNDYRILLQGKQEVLYKSYSKLDDMCAEKYPNGFNAEHLKLNVVGNDTLMVLNYTSGTTGFSKGVMLSVNNITGNVLFAKTNLDVGKGDTCVAFLPMAHVYGMAFDLLYPMVTGAFVHFVGKTPSPKVLIDAFQTVKPKNVFSVPLILEKIYKKQLLPVLNKKSMKVLTSIPLIDNKIYDQIRKKLLNVFGPNFTQVVIGGAALNREVEDFLRKIKFPMTVGYGMTECGPLISYSHHYEMRPYACGQVLDGFMEARIESADPEKIPGEVVVRGENVMMGYYKNQEATDEILKDGWLYTGDMGVMDAEKYIYLKGRSKNMILGPSGQNIYPEEIEDKLNNMPFVAESLVLESNHKVVALVYPDWTAADEINLGQADLEAIMEENQQNLNKELEAYQAVTKIKLYPTEFEKTPKRSIKRFLYRFNE